jgi:type IV pilus assembly protein PilF
VTARTAPRQTGGWRPAGLLAAVAVVLLQACVSTSTTTTSEGVTSVSETRGRVSDTEQGDIERRARVRLELASAYFARGQLDTALDEVKRSLEAKPNSGEALNLSGLIYAAMGDDSRAEDAFRRALQVNPRDGATMHNYGWFLCQRGRYAEAMTQFDQALALPQYRDADAVRTLLARGVCQGRAGQWLEAEGSLQRAYDLDPANPSTGINLADVLYRRQDYAQARYHIDRVNTVAGASNAQTLWLAIRIERQLGNAAAVKQLGEQLRARYPQSTEASLYERGRFDD